MKVKDLQRELQRIVKSNPGSSEWDIYIEFESRASKKNFERRGFKVVRDNEGWCYVEQAGYFTWFPEKKIIGIDINY